MPLLPLLQSPAKTTFLSGVDKSCGSEVKQPLAQHLTPENDSSLRWNAFLHSIRTVTPDQQGQTKITSGVKPQRRRKPGKKPGSGHWTHDEHQAFLAGLHEFGRRWTKIATRVPSRTTAQVRSHAQKYFHKLRKDQEFMLSSSSATNAVVGSLTVDSNTASS